MELIQVNRAGILDAAGGIWCRTPSQPGRVLLHRMGGCLFGRVARSAVMSCGPSHRGGARTLNGCCLIGGCSYEGHVVPRPFAPGRCSYIERCRHVGRVAPTGVMSCPVLRTRGGCSYVEWGCRRFGRVARMGGISCSVLRTGGGAPTLNVPPRPR